MKMVKIIADSTCDLSRELVEKYDIEILPLHIVLGDDEYEDGLNITPEEIYSWSDANGTTPKTSAVSIESVIDALKKYLDKVYVVNSANLSTGIGHLVVEAAVMAENGCTAQQISDAMEQMKPMVRTSFVVDTLLYLYRGGRCSGLAAMAGGVLKLHPRIEVADGKMVPGKKYRGKINAVVMSYVKDMEEQLLKARPDRVFITHSGCDDEIIKNVQEYLESLNVFENIYVTRAGGVISSHCGPGTLGVLFVAS